MVLGWGHGSYLYHISFWALYSSLSATIRKSDQNRYLPKPTSPPPRPLSKMTIIDVSLLLLPPPPCCLQAWALEVSSDGSFVLSGGHDRSLRLWRRTDEMVFLDEEREKELEGLFETELDRDDVAATGAAGGGFAPPKKAEGEGLGEGEGGGRHRTGGEAEEVDVFLTGVIGGGRGQRVRYRLLRRRKVMNVFSWYDLVECPHSQLSRDDEMRLLRPRCHTDPPAPPPLTPDPRTEPNPA